MHAFDFASHTTRGAREYQEDTATVWSADQSTSVASAKDDGSPGDHDSPRVVAALADGMGGHTGGALASQMACTHFIDAFTGEGEADDGGEDAEIEVTANTPERLVEALHVANDALGDRVADEPVLSGMGCTLIGVVIGEDGVQWVSVGDSPLFLYRRGEIAQLNEDHSLAPELDRLAEAGQMTLEEARKDPRRHMLRSAVTGEELDLVDVSKRPLMLEPGDYIILASDGLQTLQPAEIERIMLAYADDGPQAVVDALIRAVEAMRDPHQDNATVVAIRPLGTDNDVAKEVETTTPI